MLVSSISIDQLAVDDMHAKTPGTQFSGGLGVVRKTSSLHPSYGTVGAIETQSLHYKNIERKTDMETEQL